MHCTTLALQLFGVLCVLSSFALALDGSATGGHYTVTVKTDVFSTAIAYVTVTGEPPSEKLAETATPSYAVFTSVLSSETGYTTGTPTVFTSHAAGYSTTGTASSAAASASGAANTTTPVVSASPQPSGEVSAASAVKLSTAVLSLVLSLLAAVL